MNTGSQTQREDPDDDQQMAQIREILFGAESRRVSERLDQIERRLEQQVSALEAATDRRLTQTREQLHADIDKQGLRHQAALDGLDNALRALVQGLDDKLSLVDSDLQDLAQRQRQAMEQQLEEQRELARRSVSRAELAGLLEQFAGLLRRDDNT
jgi:hypothetical protein